MGAIIFAKREYGHNRKDNFIIPEMATGACPGNHVVTAGDWGMDRDYDSRREVAEIIQ